MANPAWFNKNPQRAWGFYGHRLNLYRETKPHEGFDILLKWSQNRRYFIYTANVDGAFQKAGFSSDRIVECHGSIHHVQYVNTQRSDEIWSADDIEVNIDHKTVMAAEPLPRRNGHLLRPNILMFGDWDWLSDRSDRQMERMNDWVMEGHDFSKSVVIEMGAGKVIPTTRYKSEAFQKAGASLIRINPRDFDGPRGTISIAKGAKEGLCLIDDQLTISS